MSAEPRASIPPALVSPMAAGKVEAETTVAGEDEAVVRMDAAAAAAAAGGGRAGSIGEAPSGADRRLDVPAGRAETTAAARAAVLIAAGCKAGEAGAHPTQKTNGAVLEGLAWSLAGRGGIEGVSCLEGGRGVFPKCFFVFFTSELGRR